MRARVLFLAAVLAAAPGALAAAQDRWDEEEAPRDEDMPGRLSLTAWGGSGLDTGGGGHSIPILGAEAAWSFGGLDLGLAGYGYQGLRAEEARWDPVLLVRATQRFQTYRGLDAALTFGAGAARRDGWGAWFQLALGFRLELGPMFLAGEVGFEQDLVRFTGGVGARVF
jgi:hypothetical protein